MLDRMIRTIDIESGSFSYFLFVIFAYELIHIIDINNKYGRNFVSYLNDSLGKNPVGSIIFCL